MSGNGMLSPNRMTSPSLKSGLVGETPASISITPTVTKLSGVRAGSAAPPPVVSGNIQSGGAKGAVGSQLGKLPPPPQQQQKKGVGTDDEDENSLQSSREFLTKERKRK